MTQAIPILTGDDLERFPDLAEIDFDQPWTDAPEFDTDAHPEIDVSAGLARDLAKMRTPTRRLLRDFRLDPEAFRHLKRLPRPGQSLHGVISGRYALFDLVPALIERTGEPIANLHLVTLGFSKQNGADLCAMIDARQVRRAALVCSYYFQKTSAQIYDAVIPELLKRNARVKAMRSHAKMILARMAGGARFVVESSANLRSCKNVEQFVLSNDEPLYTFHRRWLDGEILDRSEAT